ncbi:MAG: MFS transporter [Candidatus Aminicenantes bacterium]|nr:MFS transporter [Candidatus Aminicenantes bacterium]
MLKKTIGLYREAYAGLPGGAWLLAAAEFINRCGFMVLVFLNIYLTRHLGLTLPQAGTVLGAYGLGAIVGGYLGGLLVDKIGIRPVMLASLILSALTLIVTGYVTAYVPLLALMLFYGIVATALFPANDTAMSRFCFGEMRSKGFALRRLAANLGITFGPVIGGFLILVDYRLLFWVDGLTTLASAAVVAVFIKTLPARAPTAPGQAPRPTVSPWRDGPFMAFMGLFLILGLVFSQLFSTFNLYLNSVYGLRENQIGPLWAVNTILIVVIEMVLIHAVRRRSEMKIIALGAALIGIGFGLLPLGRGFFFAALTVVVWSMGEILTMPLSGTVVAFRAGDATGRYMGVLSLNFSLSMFLAPLLGNWLFAKIGGDALWPVMGGAALLAATGIWAMRKTLDVPKPVDSRSPLTPGPDSP